MDAASCAGASGSGEINEIVQLPANSGVDFVFVGTLGTASADLVVLQTTVAADHGDPNYVLNISPAASSASDINQLSGVFANGFE